MRYGLFVDIRNMFSVIDVKFHGAKLNYKLLLEDVVSKYGKPLIVKAFSTYVNDDYIRFYDALRHLGYSVEDHRSMHADMEDGYYKFNLMQAECTVHLLSSILKYAFKLDRVIICSSDKNIVPMIPRIQQNGTEVEIYSCSIPVELRRSSNYWTEMHEELTKSNKES